MSETLQTRSSGMLQVDAKQGARPIVMFAVIGALFLLVEGYTLAKWIITGHARQIGTGVTPVPEFMWWAARIQEVLLMAGAIAVLYWFVARPLLRRRGLAVEGLFLLVFATIWWQDPLLSYFQHHFTYSSVYFNLGSWAADVPGWQSPNAEKLAFPIFWGFGVYVLFFGAGSFVISKLLHWARNRWPQRSTATVVFGMWVVIALAAMIIEGFWIRTGTHAYGGAIADLTLFGGHYYQFPILECMGVSAIWVGFTSIYHFRNDLGETLAERGLSQLRVGGGRRTAVRFLALVGALNLVFVVGYQIPMQWVSLHGSVWPSDIQERSYFMNGLCGDGTQYACPGGGVPVPFKEGPSVGPDGQLSVPPGWQAPKLIPFDTGR